MSLPPTTEIISSEPLKAVRMTRRLPATRAIPRLVTVQALMLTVTIAMHANEPFFLTPTKVEGKVETKHISSDLLDEFIVHAWDSSDGLPQNHVDKVARDRQGYLWVTTWVGLCRFNGSEFVTFTPVNTPVLRSDTFSDLVVDPTGELWASSKDGLYRIRGTTFDYFGREQGLPGTDILSMEKGPAGNIWLGTTEGLARFDGTNAVAFQPGDEPVVTQGIQFLPGGKALVFNALSAKLVISSFDPSTGKYGLLPARYALEGNHLHREFIGPDRDGVLWFRTEDKIYRQMSDGSVVEWRTIAEPLKSEHVLLLCDSHGDVWLNGQKPGVLERYSEGTIASIDLGSSYHITSFNSMTEEPGGLYWLCTGQGLVQLRQRVVRNFGRRHGLLHDFIFSLADLGHGRALLGTRRWPAILDLQKDEMELFLLPGVNTTSRSLIPNADGSFWVTDGDRGPTHVSPQGVVMRSSLSASWPAPSEQYVFYRDSIQRLWIGCETNLYIVRSNEVQCITGRSIPGFRPDGIRVVKEMADHSIWLGGKGIGVNVLSPDASTLVARFTTTNGLSHDDVWAIEEGENGDVWVGTGNGLNRIRTNRCQKLLPVDGLLEAGINQILRDKYGYLWLTGNRGIYRLDPNELSDYLDGKKGDFNIMPVTRDDGLLSAETNGEEQPAGFVDRDGLLWIPTISGVVVLDPSRFRSDAKPSRPIIERITIDGDVYYDNGPGSEGKKSLKQIFRLAPGSGQLLEIHFSAPDVKLKGEATYQIRLTGHDNSWRPFGHQTTATYTTLRPGDYSFDLRVSNHHRQTSSRSTEFRFHIAAYPYQTWSFWVLVFALVAAGSYYLHRRRLAIASHIQDLEQRNALISERERIARDMHDDLGSRLTHISLLADLTKRAKTGQTPDKLDELNRASREAARAVEEIVWAANPGNDTLASLMTYMTQHAGNVLSAAGIACRVDAADEWPECYLSPERRHSAFMAFKEAINNLVKHAHATEVRLSLRPEGNQAHIRIADNGRGFNQNADRQDEQDGLDNMANRMTKIGGSCRIESQPGSGTVVELIFTWETTS